MVGALFFAWWALDPGAAASQFGVWWAAPSARVPATAHISCSLAFHGRICALAQRRTDLILCMLRTDPFYGLNVWAPISTLVISLRERAMNCYTSWALCGGRLCCPACCLRTFAKGIQACRRRTSSGVSGLKCRFK